MKKIIKCPHCNIGKLEVSQTADIQLLITDRGLIPNLSPDSIGYLDSIYIYCPNCSASDDDSDELNEILNELI